MATYYKYAERNASSEINWAEVSRNLSDMLKEENRVREELKSKLDENTRKVGETLANAPTGMSKSVNEFSLKYGSDATDALMMQEKLFKTGQLKLKDYLVLRQNLTDGTNSMFSLIKEYQEEYKRKSERSKNGKNQLIEDFYMQSLEGFMNFSNTSAYINPTNFQVSLGKVNADGSMSMNPNDFQNINDLRNRVKQDIDYFDSDAATSKFVENTADFQKVIKDARGNITILTDPKAKEALDPQTKQAVNIFEKAMMAEFESYGAMNPYNFSSILTEDIGGYGVTFDENEAALDDKKILLRKDENNPNGPALPDFETANGKKQKDAIFEYLKNQTINKIGVKVQYTPKASSGYNQSYAKDQEAKATERQIATEWTNIFLSPDKKAASVAFIGGLDRNYTRGLTELDFSESGKVTFRYEDGGSVTHNIPATLGEWASLGTEVTGVNNIYDKMKRSGGGDPNATSQGAFDANISFKRIVPKKEEEEEAPAIKLGFPEISAYVDEGYKTGGEDNATEVADAMQLAFDGTGITFVPDEDKDFTGTRDNINVFYNGVAVGTYQVDDSGDLSKMKRDIQNAIKKGGGKGNSGGNARGG
jgi:hypothetical protein